MDQLDLFTAPAARHTDPPTAHAAADAAKLTATEMRNRVLVAHARAGEHGLNGDQLAEAVGHPYESCGPRRPSLERHDPPLIEKAGKRPNHNGLLTQVYRITAAGREAAAALSPNNTEQAA